MGQVSAKLRKTDRGYAYWCQGCEEMHGVLVPGWDFDGDLERPTFTPSVRVSSGHYSVESEATKNGRCWCTFNAELVAKGEPPSGFECSCCHTFITGGMVQFLGDCTHALAGQTLELPDLPPEFRDDH